MSWFDRQLLTHQEVTNELPVETFPSSLQPGDECTISIPVDEDDPNSEMQTLDGIIVGINVGLCHAVRYDVAVRLKGTMLYAVINQIRGYVLPRGQVTDPDGGLIAVAVVEKALEDPENRRRFMHVVENEDTES